MTILSISNSVFVRNEIPKPETGMRYSIFQKKNSDITDLFPKSYYHYDDLSDISEESTLIQGTISLG